MKAQPIDREKSAEFQDVKLDYPEETTSSQQRRTTPLGEFRVNTYTTDYQGHPAIAGLTGGGFVITWWSNLQDDSGWGVYAQRYNVNGSPLAGEFRVNTVTVERQLDASVAALAGGGFVVTWTTFNQDGHNWGVFGKRYDASGVAQGDEFQVNTHYMDVQDAAAIGALSNGGFVIMWESLNQEDAPGTGTYGIYGQRYDAVGLAQGSEFLVNTYLSDHQLQPSVAGLSAGGFVVTWMSYVQDVGSEGIYGQRYDANGVKQGSEFQVNTYSPDIQTNPSVAALSNGGFVVTWQSNLQDGSSWGIYGRRYDASGVAQGSDLRINTYTNGEQSIPSVTGLSDGGFVVTWLSIQDDDSSYGVYGQCYNASGVAQGSEFRVNTYTTNAQYYPSVAALVGGGFVVTWQSNDGQDGDSAGIYAQTYIPPILSTNNLTLNEGQTVVLTTTLLSAQDPDTADTDLTFTISNVQQGRFELESSPGTPITSFTQQQVIDGAVQFVHDDGELPPSYNVVVSDGFSTSSSAAATISFTNVNDAPQVICSGGMASYTENLAVTVIDAGIVVTDTDSANLTGATVSITGGFVSSEDLLTFTNQNGITGSYASGTEILTLTGSSSVANYQTALRSVGYRNTAENPDITARTISFVASDGTFTSSAVTRDVTVIAVNDAPVIDTSGALTLTSIAEDSANPMGDPVSSIVVAGSITDADGTAVTAIAMTSLDDTNGGWQYSADDGSSWTAVAPVSSSSSLLLGETYKIRFIPAADYNGAVTFTYRAWDQSTGAAGSKVSTSINGGITAFSSATDTASIIVTPVNDAPQVVMNSIAINQGEGITLTPLMLRAEDVDNTDTQLMFTISNVEHGQFELITNAGTPILSFTQEHINDQQVRFMPDDTAEAPSFSFSVSDGAGGSTGIVPAAIVFNSDEQNSETLSAAAIRAISISAGGAVVGGLIGFAFWKLKQHKEWEVEWEKHPLANRIRKGLNLDMPNPNSDEGQEFLRVVERLEKDLRSRGIDLSGMLGTELNDLARQVVRAVRDNVHVDHVGFWTCGSNKVSAIALRESAEIIVKEVVALRALRAETVYETRKSREMEMVVMTATVAEKS